MSNSHERAGLHEIHPTQADKSLPLAARPLRDARAKILDTHMGSGSSVIAAAQAGFETLACE